MRGRHRDQIEQRRFAGTVERVAGLRLEGGSAVRQNRSKSRANRSFVERYRVEQGLARPLDRVEHSERSGFAANARGEVGLAVPGEERMRVRVNQAGDDHAIAQVDEVAVACKIVLATDGYELSVFDDQRGIVDAAERIEIDAGLRRLGIAGNDRLSADDQRRQSMPFSSAVSMAISYLASDWRTTPIPESVVSTHASRSAASSLPSATTTIPACRLYPIPTPPP